MASTSSALRPFCAPRRFTSWISASKFTLTSGFFFAWSSVFDAAPSVLVPCAATLLLLFAGPAPDALLGPSAAEGVRERCPPPVLALDGAVACAYDDVDGPTEDDTGVDGVAEGAEFSGARPEDISSRLPLTALSGLTHARDRVSLGQGVGVTVLDMCITWMVLWYRYWYQREGHRSLH